MPPPIPASAAVMLVAMATATAMAGATTGCACPPCAAEAPSGAAPSEPSDEAAAPDASTAAATEAPASFAPSGTKNVVWDGEGAGSSAKGWADCEDKGSCTTKVEIASGEGVDGSTAVHFQGKGARWIGMGWNWFGWWPKDAGYDISPYDTLKFSLRVVLPDPNAAPPPATITVALRCSNGEKTSATVTLERFLENPGDGKWHEVEIPLAEFYKGNEGQAFDRKSVWELNLGTWSPHDRSFDIYVDNITILKK